MVARELAGDDHRRASRSSDGPVGGDHRTQSSVADLGRPAAVRLLLERRSVREGFTERPIARSVLDDIVACGLAAPSSKNAQPWRLHIVTDSGSLRAAAAAVRGAPDIDAYVPHDPATGEPQQQWESTVIASAAALASAKVGIFVENRGVFGGGLQGLRSASRDHLLPALVGYGLEMLGIGGAIQSMLVAAKAHGVEGLFMGDVVIAEDALRDQFDIRGDLVGVLVLGYTEDTPRQRKDRLGAELVVWH